MNQTHVIIVGGGFAGLECAARLAPHKRIHITLLDRNNYQQFQPLFYQVATSILSVSNAGFALRGILRGHPNVDVQMDEATTIDLPAHAVTTASGRTYRGDFLVVATGSRVNFYNIPGAREHAIPLYSLHDAVTLRSRVLKALENADLDSSGQTDGQLTFVVIGGGPTGVELAGTLSDTLQQLRKSEFHRASQLPLHVHLVEKGPVVLPAFSQASQQYAAAALEKHGVQLHLGVSVRDISPDGIALSDSLRIAAKTVIWAAGFEVTTPALLPDLPRSASGRIMIHKDLTIPSAVNTYALGDVANAADSSGKPLPQLAAVAKQAGRHCAANILATVDGNPTKPFVYSDRGIVSMIGRNAAVAELGSEHFGLVGRFAFTGWLAIHALLLTVARARMEAAIEWAWQYFTGEHPGQIIDQ